MYVCMYVFMCTFVLMVCHVCNVEEVTEAEEGRAASRESNRKQSSTATSKAQMQLQKEKEKEKKFRTAAAYRERRNTIAEPERLRRQALSHCIYVCMYVMYLCTFVPAKTYFIFNS